MSADQAVIAGTSSTDIDALVAHYAPIGRRLRRRRRLARATAAVAAPLLATALALAWQSRTPFSLVRPTADSERVEKALAEIHGMKSSLAAEKAAVEARRQALEAREAQLQRHQDELAAAMAQVERQRRELQARGDRQPDVERQLAEIAGQKRDLEQQQRRFLERGQALARELDDINRARAEIDRQRKAIAEQQAEVRKLLAELNKASANQPRPPPQAPPAAASAAPAPRTDGPDEPMAQLAAVDAGVLADMRGGFELGGDYTIAVGITRTTSINGVEEFSSAMYLEDLAAAAGGAAVPRQALDPVVIQNGPGNLVSAETLGAISPAAATIIQNTLDNQAIANRTVLDISLQNVGAVTQGLQHAQVVADSLALQR